MTLGYMGMPADFKYKSVYLKGKPVHRELDPFSLKHPAMDRGKRAKIFSPYDALKGFSDAVAAKDVLYISKPELTDEEKTEINEKLVILSSLTRNGRMARENHIAVTVEYFSPCTDRNSSAYGVKGQRVSLKGICRRVDSTLSRSITIDQATVRFDDILAIRVDGIPDNKQEMDAL